ncbi:hypothetical protein CDAR_564891 [Caerostris darwini]|uniref:Uncharacterized protein n=1 Tax=Caerostris darwini TaxID=1538125 RepID=A0AAV4Q9N5_9ARAC|nr:hypothetical protein CDAR_564891 [Caerostris darwini]
MFILCLTNNKTFGFDNEIQKHILKGHSSLSFKRQNLINSEENPNCKPKVKRCLRTIARETEMGLKWLMPSIIVRISHASREFSTVDNPPDVSVTSSHCVYR